MTFFEKADRFKLSETTKGTSLGPGEYISHKTYTIPHAVAPFGSTVTRTGPGGKQNDDSERRAEIVKELVEETAANSVAATNEVVVMQPSSVFVSQTKRFNPKESEDKPGPGQYQIVSFSEQLERENALKARVKAAKEEKRRQVDALKDLNAQRLHVPSIPGKEQKLGYTFVDGAFKVNVKGEEHQAVRHHSVGPGQYDLPPTIDPNKMRGVQWAFTEPKTVSKSKPASAVGPWSYNPNKDIKPLYKYKQSAAFASDTPRTFLPGERRNRGSTHGKWNIDDDEDEDEFIDQATPGPGYYHRDETTSSFSKASKLPPPGKYQMFNTGAERFVAQATAYPNLGPGKYYREGGLGSGTFNKVLKGGGKFQMAKEALSKDKNKVDSERGAPVPGPGYYETRQTVASPSLDASRTGEEDRAV